MRLAIVGSVSLWGDRRACDAICEAIERLSPERIVSGGALGVDTMAYYLGLYVYRLPVTTFLPDHERWAPAGYKDRNLRIAEECDQLLRIAAKDSKTYGSGWTRDQAAKLGKPTHEVLL